MNPASYHETLPGNVQVLRWPHAHSLPEEEIHRFFGARNLSSSRWSNGPGEIYGVHSHPYRKTLFCIEGSITFSLPDIGRDVELHPGDRLILPVGTRHGAVVGPQGVTCIEAGEQ
ncbi:MAG TPA: cupin domain-containing protein [Nitrospiria bacterium]|nr:cupin domain-containing protein [Nitrospiria bacterium]